MIDDYTVEIKTPRPAVLPNDLAAVLILNEKYVKMVVGDEAADLKPIGTGPYKLVEWVKEDHIAAS